MASLTCSWRSAALPAGCEIYEFAGPKIKRQLEAAATFNSNNATKRGKRGATAFLLYHSPSTAFESQLSSQCRVQLHCQVGGLLWWRCCGHASVTGGNEIPKRTQSGLSILLNTPQYRKPIKPVQHAINKNRQIFVGPWQWSRREKCRCRATIVCLRLPPLPL